MRALSMIVMLAVGACILARTGPVAAQGKCPEGRTASGQCVNPGLAEGLRKAAIVYAQPKISYTAPPILPIEDRAYAAIRDLHEIHNLFTFPPIVTGITTFPRP